ncbi:MAG TPA: glycosyltransferase family 39 protein [Candidatus Eisenbacteria bacterium]|nr:glycosyltransferase family 39 protein [Candidatus Eisenbacteria bacterium]
MEDSLQRTGEDRRGDWALLGGLAFLLFAAHLLVGGRYGYFVDELYYLACSHHLAWGYVDQPPLIAVITWLVRVTLGDSLRALHFLPAVAAGLRVILTGLIARELGARRYGMALACVCVMVAPIYLGLDSLLTMNAFESLFWMSAALIALKIFNGASQRLWLLFGLVCGVGLLNKHSMLFFGFGLFAGLLLTKQRKQFLSPWIWLGGMIAMLIFLPNLLWEIHRGFPTIELLRNVQASGRNTEVGPLKFLEMQALLIFHPLSAPVWIAGLMELLRDREGRGWRVLGITWLVIMTCMLTMHGRMYYPAPAYPMLFAAGGMAFERWFAGWKISAWLRPLWIALLAITGVLIAPFAYFPMLTVDQYIAYAKFWHFEPPRIENHRMGPLPQLYADQFGWKEMAQVMADAYHKLPLEEQKGCAIFGQNYGQAGAIDFFGAKMGLPLAISTHQNYYYWGPRGYSGQCMIIMDDTPKRLGELFGRVEKMGTVYHPLSMPYQHFDVYLCREPKFGTLEQLWPKIKHWN